jgi:hypothetical protein
VEPFHAAPWIQGRPGMNRSIFMPHGARGGGTWSASIRPPGHGVFLVGYLP